MARKQREEAAGALHHVYAHAVSSERLFVDDHDRRRYVSMLGRETVRQRWRSLSFCLMTNHVHLLIETLEPNLGMGMRRLQGDYARLFNLRHARSGALWQPRYGSTLVKTDAQLWMTTRYIARNPVAAGLIDAPERWAWSSHRSTLSGDVPAWLDRARLLDLFSGAGGDPLERYAEFVARAD